jgi:hypothetical protein
MLRTGELEAIWTRRDFCGAQDKSVRPRGKPLSKFEFRRNSMKSFRSMKIAAVFAFVLAVVSAPLAHAREGYSFKVHNNTKHKIVALLASETGESAGKFDIGDGIAAGATATLQWNKSTDGSNCEWAFTAVYDDDTHSEPVMIDFCESNLELDFDE